MQQDAATGKLLSHPTRVNVFRKSLESLVLLDLHEYLDGRKSGMKTAEDIVRLVFKSIEAQKQGKTIEEFVEDINLWNTRDSVLKKHVIPAVMCFLAGAAVTAVCFLNIWR